MRRILFFCAVAVWIGCGPEKEEKKKPSAEMDHFSTIITPAQGQYVKSGDEFNIDLSLAQEPENFEKAVIKMDGDIILSSDKWENAFSFTVNTSGMMMGVHQISTEVFYDGKSEINTATILITSDIEPKKYTFLVRNKFSHDINAYTQGLEFSDGVLYEGTGLNGKSELRRVEMRTGTVLKNVKLDEQYFGEGITITDGKIFQITYQSNKGFVYDVNSMELIKDFTYATEGWGLTHDEKNLIMSDGTNKLYFLNKETFERVKTVEVYDHIGPVNMINELEYIDGEIWANIYLTQEIIRIDPKTGKVTGKINCSGLFDPSSVMHKTDVLNGIAYDHKTGKLYFTGKLWPAIFEVEILSE